MQVLSRLVSGFVLAASLVSGSSFCFAASESDAQDLARTVEIVNSQSTFGNLIKTLEKAGFATAEERTAILNFLFDRGVTPDTPVEKTKLASGALHWGELSLVQTDDGHLKNSNGQVLNSEEKAVEVSFGEAFLSFDKRSARAKVMELFLKEARADVPLPNVARRASAAAGSMIYAALKAARFAGPKN